MWLHDRQAGQGTKFTEIQRKMIKNRILAAASAAGHALGLAAWSQRRASEKTKENKIVIVGEGKVLTEVWGFGWRDEN